MKPIYKKLSGLGFRHEDLLEEYLDHYASKYEELIQNKLTDEQALGIIKEDIDTLDVKTINKQHFYLHNKHLIMTLTGLLLAASTYFISFYKAQDPPTKSPVVFKKEQIKSGFGQRMHPIKKVLKLHKGIDIVAKKGTTVNAPGNGIVADAGYDKNYGFFIEIKHDDSFSTRYHHLSKIDVKKGEKIKMDQKIGEIGSTGLSTGPHLHYEVLKNGKHIDPMPYLNA